MKPDEYKRTMDADAAAAELDARIEAYLARYCANRRNVRKCCFCEKLGSCYVYSDLLSLARIVRAFFLERGLA